MFQLHYRMGASRLKVGRKHSAYCGLQDNPYRLDRSLNWSQRFPFVPLFVLNLDYGVDLPECCSRSANLLWVLFVEHEPPFDPDATLVVSDLGELIDGPFWMVRPHTRRHLNNYRILSVIARRIQEPEVKINLVGLGRVTVTRLCTFGPCPLHQGWLALMRVVYEGQESLHLNRNTLKLRDRTLFTGGPVSSYLAAD